MAFSIFTKSRSHHQFPIIYSIKTKEIRLAISKLLGLRKASAES